MKTTLTMNAPLNTSFINSSFSLRSSVTDVKRLLLKGWGVKVVSLMVVVMFGGSLVGQVSITALPQTYTENFNGLGSSSPTWSNNSTITGWYISTATLPISTGTTISGTCVNVGVAGVNAITDRAIGCLQSNNSNQRFGLRIKNNSNSSITSFSINFTGEQWRSFNAGTLVFEYQTSSSAITSLTAGSWTSATAFDFVSLQTSSGASLDGNATANRTEKTGTLTVTVAAASEIFFRWTRNTNSSPILAVDDISITANGTPSLTPPSLTAASSATVDGNFDITFTNANSWASNVTGITVGGTTLSTSAYTVGSNIITFKPSLSSLLQSAGSKSIVVSATGFTTATVSQNIGFGAATKLGITSHPTTPASNGAILATQPVIAIQDQYGNTVTTSSASVTAAKSDAGTWTLGGTTGVAASGGVVTFAGLTATSTAAVNNATLNFTSSGLTASGNSNSFNIPAPAPSNDLCSSPAALTINGSSVNGTTVAATYTALTSEPYSAFSDVWYTFTPGSTGSITLTTSTTGVDYDLYVFTTCPSSATSFVNGGYASSAVTSSETLTFNATSSTTYILRVVNTTSSTGSSFTISATQPTTNPLLSTSGTLVALSTTYGTASSNTSFSVSGSNLDGTAVTATPPAGYEISTGSSFTSVGTNASPLSLGSSASISTTIYVRLAASINYGSYSGNIEISGGGASSVNVATTSSSVSKKELTISGLTASNKVYDGGTSVTINGSPTYSGLQNGESFSVIGSPTWAFSDKIAGNGKAITQTGTFSAPSTNYSVTQPNLTANITKVSLTVSNASVTTKTYNGNTTATITGTLVSVISPDNVSFNGTGTYASANVGTGIPVTSSSTLSGTDAVNYTLTQPTGLTGNITIASQTITFGALSNATTATVDYSPGASASSGLTVTYTSSNTSVATIVSENIHIVGAGTTNITASQAGNTNYTAATDVVQALTVTLAPITIVTFPSSWSSTPSSAPSTSQHAKINGTVTVNRGSGLTAVSSSSRFNSSFWQLGTSLALSSNTSYLTFTVTPGNGYLLNLNNAALNFSLSSSTSGPTTYGVFTSVGGFASTSAEVGGDITTGSSISFPASGYSNLGQTEIRIYGWGATATGGTGGFASMNLTGNLPCATPAAPTVSNSTVTYDGSAKSVTAATTDIAGTTPTVDWYSASSGGSTVLSGSLTSPTNTNAGTYTYYAEAKNTVCGSVSATRTQVTVTINKATPTLSVTNTPVTYDGLTHSATASASGGGTVSNITTGGAATQTNSGSYTVIADIASSSNYNAATSVTASNTFVISKATLTVTADAKSKTYDGAIYSGGYTNSITGYVNNETASVIGGAAAYSGTAISATSAGSYSISPSVGTLAASNYTFSFITGTLTINKATLTVTADDKSKTYDGAIYSGGYTSSITGFVNNETVSVIGGAAAYGGTAISVTSAGSYSISPVIGTLVASNYTFSFSDGTLTINKATPTLSVTNTVTYNGAPQAATASASGGGTVSNITTGGAATQTNAGTYTVIADIASSSNYNAATGVTASNSFVISKANPSVTIIGTTNFTYTGLAQGPNMATNTGTGTNYTFSYSGVSTTVYGPSSTAPTNAGSYTVTATVAADANYESASSSATAFTISKAAQSITFTSTNSVFNSVADYDPGATSATSGINAITYTSSNPSVATIVSGNIHVTGVGQATITALQASSTNYNAASATQTLTVNLATSISTQPSGYTILATNANPTALTVTAIGTNLSYQWYSNTANSTSNGTSINSATSAAYTPPATLGAMYYYVVVHGDYGADVTSNVVAVVISDNFTWNGSASIDWNSAANWTPAGVPIATAIVSVPNCTNDPVIGNLNISSAGSVTLTSGTMLTLSGIITNNGTLTIENGATLVQTGTGTNTGSGTYNVKQNITGAGTTTPNGRFWYLGSPVSGATSAVYDAAGANILKYYSEPANGWQEISDNSTALAVGKGYFVQATTGTTELNFTGGNINNGSYTLNATRNTTTNAFRGYNLLTNPYPSYLDWDNVTRSNVGSTIWYRAANSAGTMVFDTYNAPAGTGTNINGSGAVTKFIPPMQSFWVNVPQGQTSGTVSFGNDQRSHYSAGVQGLRSTAQDFPAFLRLNLLDGSFVDQTILYMKPDANNTFDEYDSEKMFLGGVPQFYSTVNAKKLVLNGMKNQKARTSVPLTMELPTSKSYTFQAEEFNIEDGLILLEDKQENVIQDLTINPTYSFFGNAGTNATRFVVHFQLANAPVLVGGPLEFESLGSEDLTTENIQIVSNNQGTVIVRLDEGFKPEGSIRIFDASGRLVEQTDFNDQETTIHLNEQAGLYFVEVSAGKLMVKKKIVIE